MFGSFHQSFEQLQSCDAIDRNADDLRIERESDKAGLGKEIGRPTSPRRSREPAVGRVMVHVVGPGQSQEDVDIGECNQ